MIDKVHLYGANQIRNWKNLLYINLNDKSGQRLAIKYFSEEMMFCSQGKS
jgi:hypothetical protein